MKITLDYITKNTEEIADKKGFESSMELQAMYLMSEVGELAKELIDISKGKGDKQRTGHEMCDVLWNICSIARQLDIDLNQSVFEKLNSLETREWE